MNKQGRVVITKEIKRKEGCTKVGSRNKFKEFVLSKEMF